MIGRESSGLAACALGIMAAVLVAGHDSPPPPPGALLLGALPVQGSLTDALRAGFTYCVNTTANRLRCRKEDVTLMGQGPYGAAVDLRGGDGRGGFRQLTLWSNDDQEAVWTIGKLLKRNGWSLCRTGPSEFRGDQEIYTRAGSPVRFSIDISYWGKRRVRVLPEQGQPTGYCWSR
ncbi:hypothetical protein [Sphingomonas sp.]|uniref:hypothetical protein n=1 Tax=Sphingomonas sp. TaxID=28214 RepID=UPI0025DBC21E|nr:hypothetical protein [Sphingomonas sp.]